MIVGRIDEFGRALVRISIQATDKSPRYELEAWVDTGFTGELVIPNQLIESFGLPQHAVVVAALADGTQNVGTFQNAEVIGSQGDFPLIGVGLLAGHRLVADYDKLTLSIT